MAVGALALSATMTMACSSDDSGGGSDPQSQVAEQTITQLTDGGATVDEACIRDLAAQLSDDDANAILATDVGDDADVSAEGEELGQKIFDCVSIDGLDLDDMTDDMTDDSTMDTTEEN